MRTDLHHDRNLATHTSGQHYETPGEIRIAGLWKRFAAFIADIVPITFLVALPFYLFFGFEETWNAYRADRQNLELRAAFLAERNLIRDISSIVFLAYATILEASALQGTIGKALAGIRVVGPDGNRISLRRSLGRNVSKMLSILPLFVGVIWAAFSKQKRAWHDSIAGTFVAYRPAREGMYGMARSVD